MLPGMIQVYDLNGAGKMLVGQIPDPDSPVSNYHLDCGPLPTSAPSLRIDAEAELLGGFDGSHVGGGVRIADGPAFLVHGGLREYAPNLTLAFAGALSLDPARPSLGFGGYDRDLDAIHQHIHYRNVPFRNHGQDELFGTTDFLLVLLGDLRSNGLGGAFDGFGGNVQTGEQFHRLASRSEWHLTTHHGFHASHSRGGFQTGDPQFGVHRELTFGAIVAQEIGSVEFDRSQYGQHGLGAQFLVVGGVSAGTGNRAAVRIRRIVSQQLSQRGSPGLVYGGSQCGFDRIQIEPAILVSLLKNNP
jgi:hypothetical protein